MPDTDRSLVAEAVKEAAQLPLNDAAYALWSRKSELDRSELPALPASAAHPSRLGEPAIFARVVRQVMATLRFEAENAEYGGTFPRLKSAHPEALDGDLRKAIRLAVKLEQACNRNFSYSNVRPFWEDVRLAIEKTRKENPDLDFADSTYKALEHRMTIALR